MIRSISWVTSFAMICWLGQGTPAAWAAPAKVEVAPQVSETYRAPALSAVRNGKVVVGWEEVDDTAKVGVLGRIFDADLGAAGPVFVVADAPAEDPAVAWSSSGGEFGVVWDAHGTIMGRLFSRDAEPIGDEVVLAETYSAFGESEVASRPKLVSLEDGWIVVWRVYRTNIRGDEPRSWLTAIRVGADGLQIGEDLMIGRYTWGIAGTMDDYDLALDPKAQEWVVAWYANYWGVKTEILASRYDALGNELTYSRIARNPGTREESALDASIDGRGRTALVWVRHTGGLAYDDVFGRRLRANGSKLPSGRVHDPGRGVQGRPAVGALLNGQTLVVWEDRPIGTTDPLLRGQWFKPSDERLGDELSLSLPDSIRQTNPVATTHRSRAVLVAWEEHRADGSIQILLERFVPPSP